MPRLYSHPSSLAHRTGAHPERPARIEAVVAELERRDWLGWEPVQSPAVERDVLELVHPSAYLDAIEAACRVGGALDADTIVGPGSWEAALHACGGAVALVSDLLSGADRVGFSIHRPPGHHASPARAMGFCLLNNIAVAARWAVRRGGAERVMILDWDVHHGNGTQDVFWDDGSVLFVSIHQSPLYPGTGRSDETGGGAGTGLTVNLPVAPGSGDDVFLAAVRDVAVPRARAFAPQLLLISAGFDAHADDPLAGCIVSDAGFGALAAEAGRLADELGIPLGLVLEGGYDTAALARCVALTMEVLG